MIFIIPINARSFTVDDGIRQDDISASFSDGVLTLIIPKRGQEEAEPDVRKIDIG